MFQPSMRNILSITRGNPTLITTTFNGVDPGVNQYQTGLIVRIRIPEGFGMIGLDGFQGAITVINPTQFSIAIDTTNFDPFVVPTYQPGNNGTPAQVLAIAEVNSLLTQAVQNVLPYP
jgi:hypothetical protein